MKTKKLKKKLVLNKATIFNLNNPAMKIVKGGDEVCETNDPIRSCITFNGYTCDTCAITGKPVCMTCPYPPQV